MAILFKILRDGADFSVKADDEKPFFVGRRVSYKGRIGLYNIFGGTKLQNLNYVSADFETSNGFWALFIEPTALAEGRNFLTLNTYDRAFFTFGFGQFAAHVPGGDFVRYFRALLARPEADDYYPNLGLIAGRIHRVEEGLPPVSLEDDSSTTALMNYLNPGTDEVQDSEVINAAKLMHWTAAHEGARQAQVQQMIATYFNFMLRADKRVGIDGRSARECCIIADILHHGRGGSNTWPQVHAALRSSRPVEELLAIGGPEWEGRRNTLRKALKDRPRFDSMKWSTTQRDFV